MIKFLSQIFTLDKNPRKGLLTIEWAVIVYAVVTTFLLLFMFTKVHNPGELILGRVHVIITLAALWAVYRMIPCRFTLFARIAVQLAFLAWWYPDTYEFNRLFPNLDHVFATWEQDLFGFQPALLFSQAIPSHIFSELMDLGYSSYYVFIFVVVLFYFCFRYNEFEKASTIVLLSFLIYYIVYIFLPVTGPQFYYGAVGIDQIAKGVFPNVGDYFNTHNAALASPGYADGFFYHLVEDPKAAGERPTAAFPSSHVGVATIIMLLSMHTRNKRLTLFLLPFYILLCFSTVYIQAHYAIDAFAGLLSGVILYYALKYSLRNL